jgi:chaperonin GroEL
MDIRRGIEKGVKTAVEALKKSAKEVAGKEEIAQVASISAESAEIGNLIAEIIDMVGREGVVTVEESQSMGLSKEIVSGMQFDEGYISQYMMTNAERQEAVFDDAMILLTDKKISAVEEIVPLLEKMAQAGKKDLVILCEDIDGTALATLVVNKLRGVFNTLAIKAPGFGDRRKEMLQDIAVLTGATVITEDLGMKMQDVELTSLGNARKVIATKDKTTIVEGKAKSEKDVKDRVASIRKQIETTKSDFDKEKLQERLAKLSGGVGLIKVGAATESELNYLKLKIEDAVNATKAALAEGIVSGGGVALIDVIKSLESVVTSNEEEKIGLNILRRTLEEPLRQIAQNAGMDGSVVIENVRRKEKGIGYDASTGEYVDMIKSGIIDPVKVTRAALENAASAAAMVLTTEVAITDMPEKTPPAGMPPMPGGMGGGMGMGGMDY